MIFVLITFEVIQQNGLMTISELVSLITEADLLCRPLLGKCT
jgi:hypothetical protein